MWLIHNIVAGEFAVGMDRDVGPPRARHLRNRRVLLTETSRLQLLPILQTRKPTVSFWQLTKRALVRETLRKGAREWPTSKVRGGYRSNAEQERGPFAQYVECCTTLGRDAP